MRQNIHETKGQQRGMHKVECFFLSFFLSDIKTEFFYKKEFIRQNMNETEGYEGNTISRLLKMICLFHRISSVV